MRVKRETLVLGVKKDTRCRPNGRSSDFIAPSTANGCAMACAYCYVPRRKGYANPISRVRFSLMPEEDSKLVDVRTGRIADRIAAIDDFVAAGYEVHVNFSPVIVSEGWTGRWERLLEQLDDGIGPAAKAQLACEIIFLTHNEQLHETNLAWHPKAEDVLWRPDLQEAKWSQSGQRNVRYRRGKKGRMVAELTRRIEQRLPYCRIRYAF